MHRHTIKSIECIESYINVISTRRTTGRFSSDDEFRFHEKYTSDAVKKAEEVTGSPDIQGLVGHTFESKFKFFCDAFEYYVFNKEINDVIIDVIIPAIIKRENPETFGINRETLDKYWANEKRVYSEPDNIWQLNANELYFHLNTLLPKNIKLRQIRFDDPRINTRVKGQASYFSLKHPLGNCYGILFGGINIFSLHEYR